VTNWNSSAGSGWVALQSVMESMLQPLEDVLVASVPPGCSTALDVGCGTGATTVALAGLDLRAVGVDVSEAMVAAAAARAPELTFLCADAQRHAFEPGSFDLVASRFGVMFFDDPVAAFTNLRSACSGALRFVAWRSAAENPFMTTAERAAPPGLDVLPRDPDGPGQFAFGDEAKVRRILEDAGWADVTISPVDVTCSMPEASLLPYVGRLGPVGMALTDADDDTRARVLDTVRPAFDPFVVGDEVRFDAACWLVAAG
jgi:SAM-dependent methyltransferase